MGCSWCNTHDEIINDSNFPFLKKILYNEYISYLSFLNKMKRDLNSSIYIEKNSNNSQQEYKVTRIDFNLIPRNWFENWEKRIEYAIDNQKFKSYKYDFEYKDTDNKTKFCYELMTNELWSLIYRNKIYNIKNQTRIKVGIICNNLIIFQYTKKSNNIEIFFFKNEEDLFFTNLLFSFEKCRDEQKECMNLLNILKKSPIQEIFGNMHYDYSNQKFIEQNKKIIIYNKTFNLVEQIKNFRKRQYDILYKTPLVKESKGDSDNKSQNAENMNDIYGLNKKEKINFNHRLNNMNNIKGEGSMVGNEMSRASTIMMGNNQYTFRNNNNGMSNIKIYKQKSFKDMNNENYNEISNDANRSNMSPLKNKFLIRNKYDNSKDIALNNNEISIIDNKDLENYMEDNNESFFECILYCFFNVRKLVLGILNNKEISENKNDSFTHDLSKILHFFFDKNNRKDDDYYNISELNDNTLKNCPFYNYNNLLNFILFQNSNNIISKIINVLHLELNKSDKKEQIKYSSSQNDIFKEEKYINENDKNEEYNKFIKICNESNKSFIFDLFFGIKEVKISCDNCKNSNYKYETINLIEFSMNKLNNYYIEYAKNNNLNKKTNISVEECLNYYKKEEKQQDKTLFDCPLCNELQNYTLLNNIIKYPEVVIIFFNNHFNNYGNEEEIKIDINEKIKIFKDVYELIGIISPKNKNKVINNKYDEYIAHLKNLSNKKWLVYDNFQINNVNINDFMGKINPIVLFYQKIQ